MEFVPEVPATDTETGIREHWHCTICDKFFEDKEGKQEITDIVIPVKSSNNNNNNNNNNNIKQNDSKETNINKSKSQNNAPDTGDTPPVIPATVILFAIVLKAIVSKKRKN